MRSALCVVVLAVCLAALDCTATSGVSGEKEGGKENLSAISEAIVATTTTAAPQVPPAVLGNTVDGQEQQVEPKVEAPAGAEDGEKTEEKGAEEIRQAAAKKLAGGPEERREPENVAEGELENRGAKQSQAEGAQGSGLAPAAVTTTTTTVNNKPTGGQGISTQDGQSSLPQSQNPQQTSTAGGDSGALSQSLPAAGDQLKDSPPTGVKTVTREVPVSLAQPLPKNKGPEVDGRIASQPQEKVAGHSEASSTTEGHRDSVSKGGIQHQPPVQGNTVTLKGEREQVPAPVATATATAPETGKTVSGGASTTKTISSTSGVTAQTTTATGTKAGDTQEKRNPAVTSPATPIPKEKKDHTAVTPSTNSGQKETHTQQTLKSTTTTEEQTVSAETSTTSTSAPLQTKSSATATTLPKGFKIPQSVDKTDGSSCTSLIVTFATLVTLSVMAVAPVY